MPTSVENKGTTDSIRVVDHYGYLVEAVLVRQPTTRYIPDAKHAKPYLRHRFHNALPIDTVQHWHDRWVCVCPRIGRRREVSPPCHPRGIPHPGMH